MLGADEADQFGGVAQVAGMAHAGGQVTAQGDDAAAADRAVQLEQFADLLAAVVIFGRGALQDMQLKHRKFDLVKAQRPGTVRQWPGQIGTRPVEDRHKVVAQGGDAALRQIAQRLLIVSNPAFALAAAGFDLFMDRHALHHRPLQPGLFDQGFALQDLCHRPHLAVGNMVQRRDDAAAARLSGVGK